jgi:Alkaline phosphatase
MIKYPDYENSILSVTSSILKHYGAVPKHSTLPLLDELLKTEPRNVILMLFDGMGTASIEEILPKDSFVRNHLVSSISSVFPPQPLPQQQAFSQALPR